MAINRKRADVGYGLTNPLQTLAPEPIVAQRAPTTQDFALPGTTWLDQSAGQDIYILLQVAANVATWSNVSAGTTIIGGTNINVTGVSVVTVNVDDAPTFAGLVTGEAGLTIEAGTTTLTSDTNAARAIYLHADAGTNETIQIHADQGIFDTSINLLSDAGGITLTGLSGNIRLTPAINIVSGTSLTLNAKIGVAQFSGLTTAASATETLTITNNQTPFSPAYIIASVVDAGSGDSQLLIRRIRTVFGSFSVLIENVGSAALNGPVVVSFIILGTDNP